MPSHNPAQRLDEPTRSAAWLSARWLGVFVGALVLFGLTAARTIQWQDYGQYTLRIVEGELFNELGLALAHPLHFWLGELAIGVLPFEPAHAVALVSALGGAVTVANVFGCVWSVSRRLDAACLAAVGLALANTFWRMSTMPECYTVTTALLSAELWCLALFMRGGHACGPRPLWLVAAFFFNGLGLANHNLALLTGPILGVVLVHALLHKRVCLWRVALCMFAWCVGAMPYLLLVIVEASINGDVGGAVRSALVGNHYGDKVMNASPSIRLAGISAAFTVLSFFNLTLVFAAVGLWRSLCAAGQRAIGFAWAGALAIHLLFVLRYNVVDQHTFLLPAYTLIALFAGVGFASIAERRPAGFNRKLFVAALALVLLAPAVYVGAATLARSANALGGYARDKPYRDDYRYLFVPWGVGETSAQRMARHATALAGDDGVVLVGDSMARFAVRYTALQQGRDKLDVVSLTRDELHWDAFAGRRVVLVPASAGDEPIDPPAGMAWRADEPMYVLVPAEATTGMDEPAGDRSR
ncbi:MAG: protein O-mannosyl-transferase family [Phycisphaeraceae bacterium]